MGLIEFIIENTSRETVYKTGTIVWEYTTLGRAYNAFYYFIVYGWRYRNQIKDKVSSEVTEKLEEHHISLRMEDKKNEYLNYLKNLKIKIIG